VLCVAARACDSWQRRGISGPADAPEANISEVVPIGHENDVKKMQQTLRDKAHYRGEVDSSEER
jgi:hypothetical protein